MESTLQSRSSMAVLHPQEQQQQQMLARAQNAAQSVQNGSDLRTRDAVDQLKYLKEDQDRLLNFKATNPALFEQRSKQNEKD